MKAEINNENKAKFFAHYFEQYIGRNPLEQDAKQYVSHYFLNTNGTGRASYLLLKPLSQISDEDAIEVAKIYYGKEHVETHLDDHWKYIRAIKEEINNKIAGLSGLYIIDFLRSKGYALPWMGLNVDEMIKAGWIKLL